MNILIILGHPDRFSFNHALARAVCAVLVENRHQVVFHDLYAEGFDPFLAPEEIPLDGRVPAPIRQHCDQLQSADGIVIVHPNWWGQPPAILKGWIDRVVRPGVAYRFEEGDCGEGVPVGLLKARTALVLNTSNTPERREFTEFGDPLETIWKRCIFGLCGVPHVRRRMFNVICTSSLEQRQEWLAEARKLAAELFPAQIQA
ncbi:MAG: flavodoxin family protein [Desulfobacteraceae bacterium]|nr:MAG: flavodoxin family protein [Desulfobacteraceae bacterium]